VGPRHLRCGVRFTTVEVTQKLVAALAGADHLARLRAMDAVDASLAPTVVDALLDDGRPNALASAARLVSRFDLRTHLDRVAALVRKGAPVRVLKAAVGCLGHLGRASDVKAVARLLNHDNDMLRRAAVESLGRLHGPPSALKSALRDTSWQVRMSAAIGLGEYPEADVVGALVAAVGREDHAPTAEQIVRSVADVGGVEAVAALRVWLLDRDAAPGLRRAAARGLGELMAGGDVLESAMDDPDASVVEQAAWALGRLGGGRLSCAGEES
jgi:HEAT repeat protein